MKNKIAPILFILGLTTILLFFSFKIVKVPVYNLPNDYYANSRQYDFNSLDKSYEYYYSSKFIKVNKCDVICPNQVGFPFTMKNIYEHSGIVMSGIALNALAYILLSSAIYLLVGYVHKQIVSKRDSSKSVNNIYKK